MDDEYKDMLKDALRNAIIALNHKLEFASKVITPTSHQEIEVLTKTIVALSGLIYI